MFASAVLGMADFCDSVELILKMSQGEKISNDEISNVTKIQDELKTFTAERTLTNKKDLEFMKKLSGA